MHFTKLLTNDFRSSFEIPKVHYELGNFKLWTSKWSCEFHVEFWREVAKFIASKVHVIRCSWFVNNYKWICTKWKKILNQARLILWCLLLKCKLFERYQGTPHHRWTVWLASGLQQKCKYKSSTTRHWKVLFFHAISRMMYVLKKGLFYL